MGLARWLPISAILLGPGCRQILGLDDLECAPSFAAPAMYDTAAGPRAVTITDLNGDGFLDVITANTGAANVSRLMSNGDGTLAAKDDHNTIGMPQDIEAGDVTGDGLVDLVVMSASVNGFVVMRGNGTGGLTQEPGIGLQSVHDIAIADLNRDGIDDVVAASDYNADGHTVVYLGKTDGMLAAGVDYGGPVNAERVRIADFTGDGVLDLLVAEDTGERPLVVLPGVGDGTFGTRIDSPTPVPILTLVVGDVNNDGTADAIIGSIDPAAAVSVTVLLGNAGTLTPGAPLAQSMPLFPHHLADVDGDERLDIVAEIDAVGAAVMRGMGDGTFADAVSYPTPGNLFYVRAANLDGDNVPELIALTGSTNTVTILDGSCTYASP